MVDPKGEGLTLEVLRVGITLVQDEGLQPPPLVEEELLIPNLRVSCRAKKGLPPRAPSAGGAHKSSQKSKKRSLNWHSKCLLAAGVEVKFPEEG